MPLETELVSFASVNSQKLPEGIILDSGNNESLTPHFNTLRNPLSGYSDADVHTHNSECCHESSFRHSTSEEENFCAVSTR